MTCLPDTHLLFSCCSMHHGIYTLFSIIQNKPIRVKLTNSLDVQVSLTLINHENKHVTRLDQLEWSHATPIDFIHWTEKLKHTDAHAYSNNKHGYLNQELATTIQSRKKAQYIHITHKVNKLYIYDPHIHPYWKRWSFQRAYRIFVSIK